jgi:aspartyl-tRNA(Asn)/glutamyl-tRNA(Gln) amidotransferase subunit C
MLYCYDTLIFSGGTKMAVSEQDVSHIAELARLELSPEELDLYTDQFNEILSFFDVIREIPTEGVEPTSHVIPMATQMRDDSVQETLDKEAVLSNAPDRLEDLFRVPRIIE